MRLSTMRAAVPAALLSLVIVVPLGQPPAGAVTTLPSVTFATSTPSQTKPDDVTRLGSHVFVSFQNGVGPDGTPGPLGPDSSVAEFSAAGQRVAEFNVPGRVDGLTADSEEGRVLATANEDLHSSLWVIRPEAQGGDRLTHYTYDPSPAEPTPGSPGTLAGGTDSIAITHGRIFLAHSNPARPDSVAVYEATLDHDSHVAHLRSVFGDSDSAVDALSGQTVTLALTDPDSNRILPGAAPRFAHQLAQVSQADGQIVFVAHPGSSSPGLTVLNLHNPAALASGDPPPADDVVVSTASRGTLYVTDTAAGTVTALATDGLPRGTVFVAEASDKGTPFVGTLDLATGQLSPLGNSFQNPKGLLFVPATGAAED